MNVCAFLGMDRESGVRKAKPLNFSSYAWTGFPNHDDPDRSYVELFSAGDLADAEPVWEGSDQCR